MVLLPSKYSSHQYVLCSFGINFLQVIVLFYEKNFTAFFPQQIYFLQLLALQYWKHKDFPGGSVVQDPLLGSFGLERSPGEGNGNSLQYSCLGNPMDRGAWQATVLEVPRVQRDLVTTPPPLPHVSQRYIEPKDRIKVYQPAVKGNGGQLS